MAEPNAVIDESASPDALEAAEAKGGSNLLIILLPVILLSSVLGGFLAYSQYPTLAKIAGVINGEEEEEEEEPLAFGEFMELSNIIVNPADSDGRRLLMISLGMETAEGSILESITEREMVVRDTIIKILGTRTVEELANIEQRTLIKNQLRTAVNGVLTEGEIDRMYFTQYVLQ